MYDLKHLIKDKKKSFFIRTPISLHLPLTGSWESMLMEHFGIPSPRKPDLEL